MKTIFIVLFLVSFVTPAFAGDFQCTYSIFRNSISQKKQITSMTEILPQASIPLNNPVSGNLPARLTQDTEIDGHPLSFMGLLNNMGQLNASITDKISENERNAYVSVSDAQSGQKVTVQYNFPSSSDIKTGIVETCWYNKTITSNKTR
jgi:hypothetical protein